MDVVKRFLNYVSIDTQSEKNSNTIPSSISQKVLGKKIYDELKDIGIENVYFDSSFGFVYAKIPANCYIEDGKSIGFVAHMDTSPDESGKNIKPSIIEYEGGDIQLNENVVLSSSTYNELNNYIGKHLIVTDGTTLLGSDDKAGIAEIMSMAEYIMSNPNIKHREINILFTTDEEIASGISNLDKERFNASYAYTIDGEGLGEISYENFFAANAHISITGKRTHAEKEKNKMINSISIGIELNSLLPSNEKPEYTDGYEGFFYLTDMSGNCSSTDMIYLIREHDKSKFLNKKDLLNNIVDFLNNKYGHIIECSIVDTYSNMREKIDEGYMFLIDNVKECMTKLDITPKIIPIRGGTDGVKLTFEGIPCPNIGNGGHNFHTVYEYCCIESMEKITSLLIELVQK